MPAATSVISSGQRLFRRDDGEDEGHRILLAAAIISLGSGVIALATIRRKDFAA